MISRSLGVFLRAVLVMMLIVTPGMMIPGSRGDATQFATLVALFVGLLIVMEYSSKSPIMIEFRDARPYNEIRFGVLAILIAGLTMFMVGATSYAPIPSKMFEFGQWVSAQTNLPYSPVDLMVRMLPEGLAPDTIAIFAAGCALAFWGTALITCLLGLSIWRTGWPLSQARFNVHMNLPMFDPTCGGDIVVRLRRDARLNVLFGALLPCIIPACLQVFGHLIDPAAFANLQAMVWLIALWAFLPLNLILRGMAMYVLVGLIEEKRRQRYSEIQEDGLLA